MSTDQTRFTITISPNKTKTSFYTESGAVIERVYFDDVDEIPSGHHATVNLHVQGNVPVKVCELDVEENWIAKPDVHLPRQELVLFTAITDYTIIVKGQFIAPEWTFDLSASGTVTPMSYQGSKKRALSMDSGDESRSDVTTLLRKIPRSENVDVSGQKAKMGKGKASMVRATPSSPALAKPSKATSVSSKSGEGPDPFQDFPVIQLVSKKISELLYLAPDGAEKNHLANVLTLDLLLSDSDGSRVKDDSVVELFYYATLIDGGAFASKTNSSERLDLKDGDIPIGWKRGLVGMKAGDRRLIIIPPEWGFRPTPQDRKRSSSVIVVDCLLKHVE